MKAKRILSLILASVVLLAMVLPVSAATQEELSGFVDKAYTDGAANVPAPWKTIYHSNVAGKTIDETDFALTENGYGTFLKDATDYNYVKLTKNSGASGDAEMSLPLPLAGMTEDYVIETTLSGSEYSNTDLFFGSAFYVRWIPNGNWNYIRVLSAVTENQLLAVTEHSVYNTKSSVNIKALFKPSSNKVSLWLNDTLIVEDFQLTSSESAKVTQMRLQQKQAVSAVLYDVHVYTPLNGTQIARETIENKEVLFHEDFSGTTISSQVEQHALMTYEQKNGGLTITAPSGAGSEGTLIYLKEDQSAVTGDYDVEVTLTRKSQSGAGNVRIHFENSYDNGQYVQWGAYGSADTFHVRELPSGTFHVSGVGAANYGAMNSIKVKAHFNSTDRTTTIWINGQEVADLTDVSENLTQVKYVMIAHWPGEVVVQDVKCTTYDGTETKQIRFATDDTQNALLALATYDQGSSESGKLNTIASKRFSFAAGHVYTLDEASTAGKKLFFWNIDTLKPLYGPIEFAE